jgi:hypothetical protein
VPVLIIKSHAKGTEVLIILIIGIVGGVMLAISGQWLGIE